MNISIEIGVWNMNTLTLKDYYNQNTLRYFG